MASNLNVWVIENDIDDFSSLIDKIKGDAKNTLYTNCVCRFKIADNIVKNDKYNICFYSTKYQ